MNRRDVLAAAGAAVGFSGAVSAASSDVEDSDDHEAFLFWPEGGSLGRTAVSVGVDTLLDHADGALVTIDLEQPNGDVHSLWLTETCCWELVYALQDAGESATDERVRRDQEGDEEETANRSYLR